MSNEIVTQNESNGQIGFVETKPRDVVKRATEAAKELQQIVNARSKKLVLGDKQYLYYEDWQTLAKFDNITAKVVSTEEIRENDKLIGFSARAVALKNGEEISAAEAECCFDEPNWHNKPRFQLKSMAQTRACAKALRNCLAFIAVLANYEPTPAEEMIGNEVHNGDTAKIESATKPQITLIQNQIMNSHLITEKELEKISHYLEKGLSKAKASEIISWWLGDSKKGIEGERNKREKQEKAKQEGVSGKSKKDIIIEEINTLRHENFLDEDDAFYKAFDLNKKLEEYTEKELTIILRKLRSYVPDMTVSDEDLPEE